MIRPRPTRRHLGALAVLALGGGVAMAQVAGGSGSPARPVTVTAAAVPATPFGARPARAAAQPPVLPKGAVTRRAPPAPCAQRRRQAGGAPPSKGLLGAFAILRRDRNAADKLPAAALKALRMAGLEPVAPEAARLLRSAGDARAWVIPVPDVDRPGPFLCERGASKPREGLAVVAVGGAPAGGGGALRDLVRGIAPVATDPCAGPARDMLSVSGIVPDGVPAVLLTAPDGTAVRADVHGNGFSFVVPRARRPEPRYVVWTGRDGTPHVQPVTVFAGVPGVLCRRSRRPSPPEVTPNAVMDCAPRALAAPVVLWRRGKQLRVPRAPRPPIVTRPRNRGRRVPPAVVPVPPPPLWPQPCTAGRMLIVPPGVPPRAMPVPARPKPVPPKPPRKPGP